MPLDQVQGFVPPKASPIVEREREKEQTFANYKKHDPKIHCNWTCLYLLATLTKQSKEAAG